MAGRAAPRIPVVIEHVDLAEPQATLTLPAEDCLLIFWWRDFPVGQRFEWGAAGRAVDVARLADESVDAAALAEARQKGAALADSALLDQSAAVIICTRDRPDDLADSLHSLQKQTLRPSEIIVVDNASVSDATRQAALAAGVSYVREDRPGLDFARNAGLRVCSSAIVAFTDDDVRLHPRWLERMVAAFDVPEIKAVTGLVLPAELETEAQLHFETAWSFGRGYRTVRYGEEFFAKDRTVGCPVWEIGAGASMAFRRSVFELVGDFDERLGAGRAGCSDDSEMWHRILAAGYGCRYESSAVAFHVHRRENAGLARQIFFYMRGHSTALLVQFERTGNWGNLRRAFVSLPVWYLGRIVKRVFGTRRDTDRFLREEVLGFLSGLVFYLRTAVRRG